MEDDLVHDLEEVKKNIDEAEVMSLFFPMFRIAMVIDTRANETLGPMVRMLPMAASIEERLRTLRRLRPGFPRLSSITLIPWSRRVDSLVRLGIWERIVRRFENSGHTEAAATCGDVLEELRRLEKAEIIAAVRGDSYHTIWSDRQ